MIILRVLLTGTSKVMVKESINKKTNLENMSFDFEFNNNYITFSKKLLVLIT